jgi:cell division protein FtsB
MRVVLAERLRRDGLTSWPKILIAAVDDWTVETVQRLALHNALAADSAIHYAADLLDKYVEAGQDANAPAVQRSAGGDSNGARQDGDARDPSQEDSARSDEASAAEELINGAVAEINALRDQRAAVQRERDTVVQRDARLKSHVESLEQQLAEERERRQALERENAELRAERDRYAELIAAEDALLDEAPPPAADAFAGRRVLFFTAVEAADTRVAFARGFWELGAAQVDTYWTDKTRGPDVFPPDAVIAIDVSLMPHNDWNAILEKAKSAGAWYYSGRHGVTTMARATAAAWVKHRARK